MADSRDPTDDGSRRARAAERRARMVGRETTLALEETPRSDLAVNDRLAAVWIVSRNAWLLAGKSEAGRAMRRDVGVQRVEFEK